MKTLLLASALAFLYPALRAEPENKVILDIMPTQEYPRNSEGAFATLRSGRIIFCYSQFYGGYGDNDRSRIVEIDSDDGGNTWSPARVIVDHGSNLNAMSVSLLRLASGKLALIYLIKKTALECHPYIQLTSDEGASWSAPVRMINPPGYFVLNNDRVIQTSRGRLIAPVAFDFENQNSVFPSGDSPATAIWYYSDDGGATWKNSLTSWTTPVVSATGMQEPGVVELANGSLFSWSRTDLGTQYVDRSADGGLTWSSPQPSELISPESPASIKRLPHSDALLAIYNDHSGHFPITAATDPYMPAVPFSARSPLVAAISTDGGQTWPVRKLLENEPAGRYCYTSIHFVGDSIFLAYRIDFTPRIHGPSPEGLRLRRIARAWLESSPAR